MYETASHLYFVDVHITEERITLQRSVWSVFYYFTFDIVAELKFQLDFYRF